VPDDGRRATGSGHWGIVAGLLVLLSGPGGPQSPAAAGNLVPGPAEAVTAQSQRTILSLESPDAKSRLEQPSRPVDPGAPWIAELLARMEAALGERRGDGLAAVQLGVPVRVVLLRRRERGGPERFQAFLNPEVVRASSERTLSWEHCLSIPWGYRLTERPREIVVNYLDREGRTAAGTLAGDEAVVFQQELDHLEGRLLSAGVPRGAFVPSEAMAGFVGEILRDCGRPGQVSCDALMKSRWEARLRAAAGP
jgi:peptide deformylase